MSKNKPSTRKMLERSQCSQQSRKFWTTTIVWWQPREPQGRHIYTNYTSIKIKKLFTLLKPRLQWGDKTTTRRCIISDPTNNYYNTQQTICYGSPSVAWQQQMKRLKNIQYEKCTKNIKLYHNTKSTLHKILSPHSDRHHKQKSLKRIL